MTTSVTSCIYCSYYTWVWTDYYIREELIIKKDITTYNYKKLFFKSLKEEIDIICVSSLLVITSKI